MLEVALIWVFSKRIARIARCKGRRAFGYVLLFIGLWIVGETLGITLGIMSGRLLDPGDNSLRILSILFFGVGGVVAATKLSLYVVNNARQINELGESRPAIPPNEQYWNTREDQKIDDRYEHS